MSTSKTGIFEARSLKIIAVLNTNCYKKRRQCSKGKNAYLYSMKSLNPLDPYLRSELPVFDGRKMVLTLVSKLSRAS